jgi:hypothetical protein
MVIAMVTAVTIVGGAQAPRPRVELCARDAVVRAVARRELAAAQASVLRGMEV